LSQLKKNVDELKSKYKDISSQVNELAGSLGNSVE